MALLRRTLLRSLGTTGTVAVLAGCAGTTDETATTDPESDSAETTVDTDDATTTGSSDGDEKTTSTQAATSTQATDVDESLDPDGGPNVLESVPDRATHVVDLESVAFAPESLTVEPGDTVAFEHVEGGAHSVTAKADDIPDDADYWASGSFDSEAAAEAGFDSYEGVVSDGTVYAHTFETTGTHEYYCIPHSHVQMEGTIVVE